MKIINFKVNYKNYKLIVSDEIYQAMVYMQDLKHEIKRLRYAVKNENYKDNTWSIKTCYISSALNNLQYDLYFNNEKNVFEGACLYD